MTSEYTPVVYFTEGHDEYEVDYYYGTLKAYLERNNFLVKTINLMTVDKMPDDAELVIVASPKRDFSYAERDVLDNYFYNGGKANSVRLRKRSLLDQLNDLAGPSAKLERSKQRMKAGTAGSISIVVDVNANSIARARRSHKLRA